MEGIYSMNIDKDGLFHYEACGLPNIRLANGYEIHDTPYGQTVSVQNVDELHKLLATEIAEARTPLSKPEFRFLRKELGLSQNSLARLLGNSEQAVRSWEKVSGDQSIPRWADSIIRTLYLESIKDNTELTDLLTNLSKLDQVEYENIKVFEETNDGWTLIRNAA